MLGLVDLLGAGTRAEETNSRKEKKKVEAKQPKGRVLTFFEPGDQDMPRPSAGRLAHPGNPKKKFLWGTWGNRRLKSMPCAFF